MAEFYPRIQTREVAEIIKPDIGKEIFMLNPYGTPLTRLLTEMRTDPTDSTEYKLFEDVMPPKRDRVTANTPAGATTIPVANPTYFMVNDMISFPRLNEVAVVTNVGTNNITVTRKWGETGQGGALVNGDEIIILHEIRYEGEPPSASREIRVTARTNYVEEFSTTIEETDIAAAVAYYTKNPRAHARHKKGIEHAEKIARAMWFGKKAEVWDATTRRIRRTTGGVIPLLLAEPQCYIVDVNGTLTESDFDKQILPNIFRYNEKDKRIMFAGSILLSAITGFAKSKLVVDDMMTKKYGMRISTYMSYYPDLNVIHEPLFTGYYAGWGVVCNMDALKYRPLRGKDTKLNVNYDKSNPHLEKDEYFTVAGLGLASPQTFSIIKGVTG